MPANVYTHGMPTTRTGFLQLARDPNSTFMNHLIAHQTTFLQMEVPIWKGAICPKCDGPFQMIVLPIFALIRPKQNTCAPIATNCPTCKTCFTSEHFSMQTTTKMATSIGIQLKTLNPTKIENFINALDPLPFSDAKSNTFKIDSIVLTLTLFRYQSHYWAHSKSCFKKSARMPFGVVCHFAFPQSTTLVTMVNDDFKIIP